MFDVPDTEARYRSEAGYLRMGVGTHWFPFIHLKYIMITIQQSLQCANPQNVTSSTDVSHLNCKFVVRTKGIWYCIGSFGVQHVFTYLSVNIISGFSLSYHKLNHSALGMLSLFTSLEWITCGDIVVCLERSSRLIFSIFTSVLHPTGIDGEI